MTPETEQRATARPHIAICYDGSNAAEHAIDQIAELHPGADVTILTAWQPMEAFLMAWTIPLGDSGDVNGDIERSARQVAAEGVLHARHAGLVATEATTRAGTSIGRSLIQWCGAEHVDLIVVGATGHSAITNVFTGSVASHVLHHTTTPVLLVHAERAPKPDPSPPHRAEHADV